VLGGNGAVVAVVMGGSGYQDDVARTGRTQRRKQVPANRLVLVHCFSLLTDCRHSIVGLHLEQTSSVPEWNTNKLTEVLILSL
jgi:hypothetical protein